MRTHLAKLVHLTTLEKQQDFESIQLKKSYHLPPPPKHIFMRNDCIRRVRTGRQAGKPANHSDRILIILCQHYYLIYR